MSLPVQPMSSRKTLSSTLHKVPSSGACYKDVIRSADEITGLQWTGRDVEAVPRTNPPQRHITGRASAQLSSPGNTRRLGLGMMQVEAQVFRAEIGISSEKCDLSASALLLKLPARTLFFLLTGVVERELGLGLCPLRHTFPSGRRRAAGSQRIMSSS